MKWQGRTVVCIASGPSLTPEDCELVRKSGHLVVVTNTTFRLCPWADVLYGFDARWWKQYEEELKDFRGEKLSASGVSENYGAHKQAIGYRNSGVCAIALAMVRGASKVVMLGYDVGFWEGRKHWHEDYPDLPNAHTIAEWPSQFAHLAKQARLRGVEIVNASRRTALGCFPLVPLEEAL